MANQTIIHGTTFHVGDTIRVHYRIIEKEVVSGKAKREKHEEQKERIQVFEGIVIAIRGTRNGKSFVVRRIGIGSIGIERIFPVISPWIKKVTVMKRGDVRRAKLYYLRDKKGRNATRITEKKDDEPVTPAVSAPVVAPVTPDVKSTPESSTQG